MKTTNKRAKKTNGRTNHRKNENTDDHKRTKTDRRLYEETKKRTLKTYERTRKNERTDRPYGQATGVASRRITLTTLPCVSVH